MSTEIIYTDGACSKNGQTRSVGGFGMFIAKSTIAAEPIKINRKGEHMEFRLNGELNGFFHITNIRMEGLAIVSTLALYANIAIEDVANGVVNMEERLSNLKPFDLANRRMVYGPNELRVSNARRNISIEIVTDSLFWMNVINDWLPKWIQKNIWMEKKNPDILMMLRYYTELLRQNEIELKFTHVKSHQKRKRTEHADGNDVADELATSSVNNPTTAFYMK